MAGAGEFPKDDTAPKTDIIYASDFNTIRTAILAIIGVGSGTSGYGASQANDLVGAVSAQGTVFGSSWDSLRTAINACRSHQAASPTLIAARPTKLTAAWINSVKTISDAAVTNKDSTAASELVAVTGLTSSVTTSTTWNGTLNKTVRVTFASQNNMRNFFNAGGYISITHAAVTGHSGTKETNWKAAIDSLGELRFGRTQYRTSGEQTLGSASVTSYDGSYVSITGARNTSGAAYVDIVFLYDDGNAASGLPIESNPAQTGRIDEMLSLNISSTVSYVKSAGQITTPTPNDTSAWTDSGYSTGSTTPSTPTYAFSSSPASINEGSSGTFNVTTTNVTNGTTLYWSVSHGTTAAGDFSATSGTVSINSNTGSISVSIVADAATEGSQSFNLQLRTGSVSGTVVATSDLVTINDTSTAPGAATYSFSSVPTSINEGSSGSFTVTTTNVPDGTTLYWSINHSSTAAGDFSASSGNFTVTTNSGTFTISPTSDSSTEGAETFTVSVRTGSVSGTVVATSASVTVNDTSVGGAASYSFSSVPTSINEGSTGTFNVTTTNVASGTTLYWTISHGTTAAGDFGATNGSFTITAGSGSFNVSLSADVTTEGAETFTVQLRTTSISGTVVATSASVTVNDTSTAPASPTYSFTTTPSSINEGSSGSFTVTTTNVANGTTLWWVVDNITTGGDFGTLFGSFTINSGTGSFTVTPTADAATEGPETFRILIKTGSQTGTTVATSASVTVNDTSTDVTYNYAPEWLDEFAAGYGYTNTSLRSIFLTNGQSIANAYYLPNSAITTSLSPQRYGLYRKPDGGGLAFWADYAYDNGLSVGQTLADAFFGALGGADATRALTNSKSFDSGTGDGDFYDKSVPG